jgi:hypothetical protein
MGNPFGRNLGLLANATITYIITPRWIIDYVYFNKVHMLKRGKNGKTMIMYKDYTNEFEMPNRNLGLYVVESFIFDLQKKGAEPCRSASARFTRNLNPRYHGEDIALAGPAFTSYAGFDQAGPSLVHHLGHDGWEQPTPHHSPTFDNTSSKNRIIGIGCSVASTLAIRRCLSEHHFNS